SSPDTWESTKQSLKPFARGKPGHPVGSVVTCLRAFFHCTQGCGCQPCTRLSLRPRSRGTRSAQHPGKSCRGNEDSCLNPVMARSPRQNCEAILRWSDEAIGADNLFGTPDLQHSLLREANRMLPASPRGAVLLSPDCRKSLLSPAAR